MMGKVNVAVTGVIPTKPMSFILSIAQAAELPDGALLLCQILAFGTVVRLEWREKEVMML